MTQHGKQLATGGVVYNAGLYSVAMRSVAWPSTPGPRVAISSAYLQHLFATKREERR